MKNQTKHMFYGLASFLTLLTPVLIIGALIVPPMFSKIPIYYDKITITISVVMIILNIVLHKPLNDKYLKYKELAEYDEFGQRKGKRRYDYSKEQRDMLDLQRMADMERILPQSTLKKITKKGSENPDHDMKNLIGLAPVKQKMSEMAARMAFERSDRKHKKSPKEARHMVFYGSPGTGKTTVARIITGFLYKYKYIKQNKCIEVDGNFLKSTTPDDTATKVKYIIRSAYGGVLFIDEAYALKDDGFGCGKEAIATLIKEMEDHRDEFVLILAGYRDEMRELLSANPGFHSRIKEYLDFPDYNEKELRQIFRLMAKEKGYTIEKTAYPAFDLRMKKEKRLSSYGNARTVRNVLEEAIDRHSFNFINKKMPKEKKHELQYMDINQNIDPNKI